MKIGEEERREKSILKRILGEWCGYSPSLGRHKQTQLSFLWISLSLALYLSIYLSLYLSLYLSIVCLLLVFLVHHLYGEGGLATVVYISRSLYSQRWKENDAVPTLIGPCSEFARTKWVNWWFIHDPPALRSPRCQCRYIAYTILPTSLYFASAQLLFFSLSPISLVSLSYTACSCDEEKENERVRREIERDLPPSSASGTYIYICNTEFVLRLQKEKMSLHSVSFYLL